RSRLFYSKQYASNLNRSHLHPVDLSGTILAIEVSATEAVRQQRRSGETSQPLRRARRLIIKGTRGKS
ncbi:MAG: hypothetical protein ACM3KL_08695, partial [Alphaproteobacteria bacterium]